MDRGRVVGVEQDERGRVVVLVLATGVKVPAHEGYWTIYVNPKAFFIEREGRRFYVRVVSPTVAEGAYYRIPANDNGTV